MTGQKWATKWYQEGRRRPLIRFRRWSAVADLAMFTCRRYTAWTPTPTHLAQPDCPCTSKSNPRPATPCSTLRLQHHRHSIAVVNISLRVLLARSSRSWREQKRSLPSLTVRALIQGRCATTISGMSWFRFHSTPAQEVADSVHGEGYSSGTRGSREEEVESVSGNGLAQASTTTWHALSGASSRSATFVLLKRHRSGTAVLKYCRQ